MKRSAIYSAGVLMTTAVFYVALTYSAQDDARKRDQAGFLGILEIGQQVVLAERDSGFFAIYVENPAVSQSKELEELFRGFSIDRYRVMKVTESYVELRGKSSQDLTLPEGFDNIKILPQHAIISIAYYSPEQA